MANIIPNKDSLLVAIWGKRWKIFSEYQQRELRVQYYLSLQRMKDQQTVVAAALSNAVEGDKESLTMAYEKLLGIA